MRTTFPAGTLPRNCEQAGRFSTVAGKRNKRVPLEGLFMSDNFWDVKLSEKEELAEQKKEDDSKTKATTPVPKVEVDLADFPATLNLFFQQVSLIRLQRNGNIKRLISGRFDSL